MDSEEGTETSTWGVAHMQHIHSINGQQLLVIHTERKRLGEQEMLAHLAADQQAAVLRVEQRAPHSIVRPLRMAGNFVGGA